MAIALAGAAGCSMLAPLDDLTGNDAGVGGGDEQLTGHDAGRDASADAAIDSAHGPDAGDAGNAGDAGGGAGDTGAQGADAADGATAGDSGATGDSGSTGEAGPTDAAAETTPPPAIAFVQLAATSSTSTAAASVAAKMNQPQAAGDLNVVAIGWNDATGGVASVTDTSGNTYDLAVGPTRFSPDLTQAIYYAKNIAAAAAGNAIKVTFVQPANTPDLRVMEYAGLDPSAPLDQTASATGKGTGAVSTQPVSIAVGRELLVVAGMTTDTYQAPGAGYTSRIITANGDIDEDRVVSAVGSYVGDASMGSVTAEWIVQLATFR